MERQTVARIGDARDLRIGDAALIVPFARRLRIAARHKDVVLGDIHLLRVGEEGDVPVDGEPFAQPHDDGIARSRGGVGTDDVLHGQALHLVRCAHLRQERGFVRKIGIVSDGKVGDEQEVLADLA